MTEQTAVVPKIGGARTWKWLKIDRARSGNAVTLIGANQPARGGIIAGAKDAIPRTVYDVPDGEERTIVLGCQSAAVNVGAHSACHIMRVQTSVICRANTNSAALLITAGEDAKVTFAEVILPEDNGGSLSPNACAGLTMPDVGESSHGTIYSDFTVRLTGARSSFKSDVAYMAPKGCTVDVCHTVHHNGRATHSLMRIAGSVAEGGDKVYRGTIDFHKGCSGSKGEETEEVLMLSPAAKNRSLPVILCDEEDVEGEHGATIGRLDAAALFYVNSRGMSCEDAIDMICRAKLERVARLFRDEGERKKALAVIEERFGATAKDGDICHCDCEQ